jgi:DNA (cytosine-5)-methyltransferase 1
VRELALFAGIGGGILGGRILGWRTVCAVEIDPYCRRILCDRQDDGTFGPFPIWDDIKTFDGRPWRGLVDVVSGGFPCQDISASGKGEGITGNKSGLWTEMARVIGEVRPRFVYVENSPLLVSRGLARVLGDFAKMGYDAKWGVMGAHHIGAPHRRDRIWVLGYVADSDRRRIWGSSGGTLELKVRTKTLSPGPAADPNSERLRHKPEHLIGEPSPTESPDNGTARPLADSNSDRELQPSRPLEKGGQWTGDSSQGGRASDVSDTDSDDGERGAAEPLQGFRELPAEPPRVCEDLGAVWSTEPRLGRLAHGVPGRVHRLRSIGNAQVPQVVVAAFRELMKD